MNSLNILTGTPVAGLQSLPQPLVRDIASYLADEDMRVAGAVNRAFRHATEDRRLALDIRAHFSVWRPGSEAMPAFQAFLVRIGNLDRYMQGHPLAALSDRLSRLFDVEDRTRVVDQSLALIGQMPAHFQRAPLVALLPRFWEMRLEDRHDRFDVVLHLAKHMLPSERWPVVAELIELLAALSDESMPDRFDALLAMVNEAPTGLRSGPMARLAHQLRRLPEDLRQDGFDAVLESVEKLPVDQWAQPLAALAGGLCALPDDLATLRVLDAFLALVDLMVEGQDEVLTHAIQALYGLGSVARRHARVMLSDFAARLPFEQGVLVRTLLDQVGL